MLILLLLGAAFVGFVALGNWQLRRLEWKLGLIEAVQTRVHAAAVVAPGPKVWPRIEAGELQYLHVRLHGHFLPRRPILVRGTSPEGYGYWLLAPFQTRRGFVVLVNRGYIPPTLPGTVSFDKVRLPTGEVVLTGLLRFSEPGGHAIRDNQPGKGQWYSRDVAAMGHAMGLPAEQLAPYFVDADASASGNPWPAAGLTKIRFRNNHLGYAITWYLMAVGSLLAAGIILYHDRRGGGAGE